jgi:integrase
MLKLTDKAIKALPAPSGHTANGKPRKDYIRAFADPRNLRIRVTVTGKFFQADTPSGPVAIGRYGDVTPDAAATAARVIAGQVASGRDPGADRKAAKAASLKAAADARALAAEQAYTVRKLFDAWGQARADKGKRESYLDVARGTLQRHLADWLDRPANSITTAETVARLDDIKTATLDGKGRQQGGPVAANRCLAYGRAAFGWAKSRQLLEANPFEDIERPGRETARERVLSREEVGTIWRAGEKLPVPYGAFVRFLLLTLMRRDECAGLRWDELTPDLTAWMLPADRSKNHRSHVTHLTDAARQVIAGVPRIVACPYVFPGAANTPVNAFSHAKRLLDAAIADDLGSHATPWTFHDIRRTGVTRLAESGIAPHVADRLLNHVSGAALGMLPAVYQRAEFATERKAALERWSEYVLAAGERRELAENVIEFAKAS